MRLSRRPSLWVYTACAVAVVAGLVWVTWQALGLESRERAARDAADRQESMRLALWRMDSALSPIIAQEAARPYFQYRAFYPADRAYTRMWEPVETGEVLVASPLLSGPGQFILLHFELAPDGTLTSPQAPTGDMRIQAETGAVSPAQIAGAEGRLGELSRVLGRGRDLALKDRLAGAAGDLDAQAPPPIASLSSEKEGLAKSEAEYRSRKQTADSARNVQQQAFGLSQSEDQAKPEARADNRRDELARSLSAPGAPAFRDAESGEQLGMFDMSASGAPSSKAAPIVGQGPLEPLWISGGPGEGPYLLFVRRVTLGGAEFVQGFWMDWPALRDWLISLIPDILPGAEVRPIYSESGQTAQMLAAIPAFLSASAPAPISVGLLTPTRAALAMTWGAGLAALIAVGIVLRKSIDLAERRGQFVSAVTHELRTPLTTFCLYTQMLADGMVQTESARADYLGTLKRESRRLARIVENVLEYARLGQRARGAAAAQTVEDLIAAVAPALSEQASRSGMDLVIDHAPAAGSSTPADTATVERILTNLVENSTKYATGAADRRLHLDFTRRAQSIEIRYRDHGPGIPRSEEGRVFQPFHRAERDADGPTPGLGLGLALSRGLARELGGDLRLIHEKGEGAEFLLILPVS